MGTIRLRGIKEAGTDKRLFLGEAEGDGAPLTVTAKGRVRLEVARDFGGVVDLSGMKTDDIACVEYSNGFKLWTRVDDLCAEQGRSAMRGSGTDPDIWVIDPQAQGTERGVGGIAVEAREFFGVELKGVAASKLCEWFEAKQLQAQGPGIYRFGPLTGEFKLNLLCVNTLNFWSVWPRPLNSWR